MVKDPKPEEEHHRVEATVVSVDPGIEPIKSVVVGDTRDKFGRRLGILAIIILVLFFLINGYIQSAKNGASLHRAEKERTALVHSIENVTTISDEQITLIKHLQEALREQNKLLSKAGFKTVHIPGTGPSGNDPANPSGQSQPSSNSPRPGPGSSPPSSPRPKPSHRPSPKPSPDPTQGVKDTVCSLTGICLQSREINDSEQQAVRPVEVYRAGSTPSGWNAIFRVVADLGLALWW